MSILKANLYKDKITDITPYYFVERDIKAVLIDLDNTVIDPEFNEIDEEIHEWLADLKANGVAVCFVSNRFDQEKEEELSEQLQAKVIMRAYKPLSKGLKSSLEHLEIPKEAVCIIGDQTFTDVLGGNLIGVHTIKVKPINQCREDGALSSFCRRLEELYFSWRDNEEKFEETQTEMKVKRLLKLREKNN